MWSFSREKLRIKMTRTRLRVLVHLLIIKGIIHQNYVFVFFSFFIYIYIT